MTSELINVRSLELPTKLYGFNEGLIKSNIENLKADEKLIIDQCLKMKSKQSRNNFCEAYANDYQKDFCNNNFCKSCCKMTLSPSEYSTQALNCELLCNKIKVYDNVRNDINSCINIKNI